MGIEQGQKAPEFTLNNYKGEKVSLTDLENFDGVLVIFMCNHCPYVKAQVDQIKRIDEKFSSLAVVGINSNVDTHPEDTVEKMDDFMDQNNLDIYYLADPDQSVAEKYGAKCTPDPFLLDYRHKLYYHGRLNDKEGPKDDLNDREMEEIIQDMLKRREPPKESKKPIGCSIKWKNQDN